MVLLFCYICVCFFHQEIITPLHVHQKQALHWMMMKEKGDQLPPFWELKADVYHNNITYQKQTTKPRSIKGGEKFTIAGPILTNVIFWVLLITEMLENMCRLYTSDRIECKTTHKHTYRKHLDF